MKVQPSHALATAKPWLGRAAYTAQDEDSSLTPHVETHTHTHTQTHTYTRTHTTAQRTGQKHVDTLTHRETWQLTGT